MEQICCCCCCCCCFYVDQVVMSVCWKGSDHQFAVFYSNGVIQTYTAKPKSNTSKSKKSLCLRGHTSQALSTSHGRVRYLYLNQSPCLVSSESVTKNQLASTQHTLVLHRKRKGTGGPMLLSYSDPVINFLPIPQFPFPEAGNPMMGMVFNCSSCLSYTAKTLDCILSCRSFQFKVCDVK